MIDNKQAMPELPVVAWFTNMQLDGKRVLTMGEAVTNPAYTEYHHQWKWEPLCKVSDAQAYAESLRSEMERDVAEMRQTMAAAAEEIHEHWQAHCDSEGYGPDNLQRRLEGQYGVNYPGYTLGAFQTLQSELKAARAAAQAVLDQWDSPKRDWHKLGPTADLMANLRRTVLSNTKEQK